MEKKKDLWMAFVDLEKAFNRVPREVVWWALKCLGVKEWLVTVIIAMYETVTTKIKPRDREIDSFDVKVGVHQEPVLSPLLFIIILEALSKKFRVICKQWVHKKCSGIQGSLKIVGFECRNCTIGEYREEIGKEVEIISGGKMLVNFVILEIQLDQLVEPKKLSLSMTRVRSAWAKFRELSLLLTERSVSLKIKGKLYIIYVQSVVMYGSETWAMKVDDVQCL
ncbi:uncharacterized protein LOC124816381 [Hydra vulgaris]|uniref:uncharacterized protein LOC124816381 n=1 Tax=Hydra vulgaris TaxID=6087 RepID=UPI001F5F326B|nr:uncharacterized protein LOC124816381 [Hydra vulgaris]